MRDVRGLGDGLPRADLLELDAVELCLRLVELEPGRPRADPANAQRSGDCRRQSWCPAQESPQPSAEASEPFPTTGRSFMPFPAVSDSSSVSTFSVLPPVPPPPNGAGVHQDHSVQSTHCVAQKFAGRVPAPHHPHPRAVPGLEHAAVLDVAERRDRVVVARARDEHAVPVDVAVVPEVRARLAVGR